MATKHPKFVRPNLSSMKRLGETWRHGRGIDSKQARKVKWAGATPNIGYQGEAAKRDNHPQGKKEFYVRNVAELEKFKDSLNGFVIRMQAGLSKRSKETIRKKALEFKLHVVN